MRNLVRRAVLGAAALGLLAGGIVTAAPDESIVTVADVGAIGWYSSLVLDDAGNPVIAYYDNSGWDLRLVHCDDPLCAGVETPVIVDDLVSVTGWHPSLALDAAGNPVISYFALTGGDLLVVHCDDPSCAGGETPVAVATDGQTGMFSSLVLDAAGNPVISYYNNTHDDLLLVHCDDPSCAGGETPVIVDDVGATGLYTSLVLDAAGNPVISYHDGTNDDLLLVHCDDPLCAGVETPVNVDDVGQTGLYTSLALDAAGNPVISYYDATNDNLRLVHCDDPLCAGVETPVTLDAVGHEEIYSSLVLDAAGNPVVSYYDATNGDLRLLHCDDPLCAGVETPKSVDAVGNTGRFPSMALDAAGNPVVSYQDVTHEDLRLVHCNDANCADDVTGPTATITLGPGQNPATNTLPIEFTVTFDETVVGFDATDLIVTGTAGATTATLSGTGPAYTVTVDAVANDGTVVIDIAAGAVTDVVANPSNPSQLTENTVVVNTVDPVLDAPSAVAATAASGATHAVVTFDPTATDDLDTSVTVICDPASGSTFPIGDSTVTCTATDSAGNVVTAVFTVTVEAGPQPSTTVVPTTAPPTTGEPPTTEPPTNVPSTATPTGELPATGNNPQPAALAALLVVVGLALTAVTRRRYG